MRGLGSERAKEKQRRRERAQRRCNGEVGRGGTRWSSISGTGWGGPAASVGRAPTVLSPSDPPALPDPAATVAVDDHSPLLRQEGGTRQRGRHQEHTHKYPTHPTEKVNAFGREVGGEDSRGGSKRGTAYLIGQPWRVGITHVLRLRVFPGAWRRTRSSDHTAQHRPRSGKRDGIQRRYPQQTVSCRHRWAWGTGQRRLTEGRGQCEGKP